VNVLLLTQVVPYPPDSGPRIKTYHVLRYLARRHAVHLVSFARSADERAAAERLREHCASVVTVPLQRARWRDLLYLARSLVSGRPLLIERDDLPAMRRAVAEICARQPIEALHADQLAMAQYGLDLPLQLRLLDAHNAVWTIVRRAAQRERGPRRLLAELEWRKLRAYEGRVCRRLDRIVVVSAEDERALVEAAGRPLPTTIVPIAVDVQALPFAPPGPAAGDVLSLATMFYPPNVDGVCWFAEQVFPLIRARRPATRFLVVGARPPARVARLAGPAGGIEVTGYLADLEPALRRSGVLVVPLHAGSGMRVKILEAFARGIPVVSTSIGVEGIAARAGEHLLVADRPAAFAQAVLNLLEQPAEAARLAAAARALVEQRYDWRTALSGLDALYGAPAEAAAARGAR
jgi:sugar transferase (PEP-CTERM/EpsH1 system associated)